VIVCDEIKYIYIYNDCGGLVLCFCSGQRGCGCRPTSGGGGGDSRIRAEVEGKNCRKSLRRSLALGGCVLGGATVFWRCVVVVVMVAVLLAIADSCPGGILVWLWGGPGLGGGPGCGEFLAVGLSWRGTGVLGLFRAYPPLVSVLVSATEEE
jgi:hypothetical protein